MRQRSGSPVRRAATQPVTVKNIVAVYADVLPVEIARGSAGDCCVKCGRVGEDLPNEHGCVPNVTDEELARSGWAL